MRAGESNHFSSEGESLPVSDRDFQMREKKEMRIRSTMLAGMILLGGLTPGIKRENQTTSSFLTSSVLADLQSDESFDADDYPIQTDSEDIELLTITRESTETTGYSVYLYLFNEGGTALETDLSSTRITMSCQSDDYSDTEYYSLNLIDCTADHRFYKFQTTTEETDVYHISEIEFDYGNGYSEGRHQTIGKSFFYETEDANPSWTKGLEVVNLTISPGSYRFKTINGNGYYTDLFYVTFTLNQSYGDLIGIRLSWIEDVTDYYEKSNLSTMTSYSTDNSYVSELITMDYSNTDLMNIVSINTIGSSFGKFIFNISPRYWFTDKSTDYENIPVIEKIVYDNGASSSFDDYYLNADTITTLNNQYYDSLGGNKVPYVIRFALKDYYWDSSFNSGTKTINHQKTEIKDCDVLTLTFSKDGKVYSLMASGQPVDYDPGIDNENWWDKLIALILEKLKEIFGPYADAAFKVLIAIIVLLVIVVARWLFIPKKKRG